MVATEEASQHVLSNATRCISVNRGETPDRGRKRISVREMPGRLVERAESNPKTEKGIRTPSYSGISHKVILPILVADPRCSSMCLIRTNLGILLVSPLGSRGDLHQHYR